MVKGNVRDVEDVAGCKEDEGSLEGYKKDVNSIRKVKKNRRIGNCKEGAGEFV